MFSKVQCWWSMAATSAVYAEASAGLDDRVLAAAEWDDLSVEDRAFLTRCIRDVENKTPGMGNYVEADRRADAAEESGVPDTSGPIEGVPYAPDLPLAWTAPGTRPAGWVEADLDNDAADDGAAEAKGIDFDDDGWIGL